MTLQLGDRPQSEELGMLLGLFVSSTENQSHQGDFNLENSSITIWWADDKRVFNFCRATGLKRVVSVYQIIRVVAMGFVTALKRFIRAVVPHLIVLSLLAGYLIFGAVIFSYLEEGKSDVEVFNTAMRKLKEKFGAESLVKDSGSGEVAMAPGGGMDIETMMDEVLNNSFRPEWKVGRMQAVQSERAWSFASSMLFCMTTITTIGYGDVVPVTVGGKVFCVLYSVFGIPLCVLYMGGVGSFLAQAILTLCRIFKLGRPIKKALCCCCSKNKKDEKYDLKRDDVELEETRALSVKKKKKAPPTDAAADSQDLTVVTTQNGGGSETEYLDELEAPVLLVLAILIGYMCAGAFLISRIEGWGFGDALYFTYITLTTIGFGDYVPMKLYKEDAYFVCVIYCLFGLAVMSMSITLVQAKVRRLGDRFWNFIGF